AESKSGLLGACLTFTKPEPGQDPRKPVVRAVRKGRWQAAWVGYADAKLNVAIAVPRVVAGEHSQPRPARLTNHMRTVCDKLNRRKRPTAEAHLEPPAEPLVSRRRITSEFVVRFARQRHSKAQQQEGAAERSHRRKHPLTLRGLGS